MKELIKSISKNEWRFVAVMALVMIVLVGLPYFYAFLRTPAGTIYNGLNSLTSGDNPIYYSWIEQNSRGEIFMKDPFTNEPQAVGLFNIFWFSVGLLSRIFNLSPIFAFHLSRLLLAPIFIFVAYVFISLFFPEATWRKTALIFLLFTSGIGAYFIAPLSFFDLSDKVGFWSPTDLWVPESITFLSLYKTPHFIASLIFMILIFLLMILSFSRKRLSYSIFAGFLALIYFNFHPYYIVTIFGSLGLYLLVLIFKEKKILYPQVGYYLLFIVLSSPSIFYHFWLLQNSPIMSWRNFQNVTLSPPFIFILIGYGFLWLLAGGGVFFLIKYKKFNNYFLFLIVWLLFSIFLVIFPNQYQSRYTQGLHFSLVIFSIIGYYGLREMILKKINLEKHGLWFDNRPLLAVLFILLLAISNIFNLFRDFYYFTFQPPPVKDYFYLPKEVVAAMKYLRQLPAGQTILAHPFDSFFIPGFSGQTVYAAHGIETINYEAKLPYLFWFFSSDKQAQKKYQFLINENIDYVFFRNQEKNLGLFNPDSKDYLKLVYQNLTVSVYQVIK